MTATCPSCTTKVFQMSWLRFACLTVSCETAVATLSLQEELKLFVLARFGHMNFCCIRDFNFFSSKKGLNKDKNSIGHLSLLCLVSRSLCELRECKRVTSS